MSGEYSLVNIAITIKSRARTTASHTSILILLSPSAYITLQYLLHPLTAIPTFTMVYYAYVKWVSRVINCIPSQCPNPTSRSPRRSDIGVTSLPHPMLGPLMSGGARHPPKPTTRSRVWHPTFTRGVVVHKFGILPLKWRIRSCLRL